jgi:glycosyltransferase involved in cell wall biosynthesis
VNQAKKLILKLERPDLLYITSTPLTTGLLGLWAKKRLAIPYIFEVRDLWPKAPIEVGAIKNPLLIQWLKKLERRIYDQSMSLVALSPGIGSHLRDIAPGKKIALIPNFSDLDRFYPQRKRGETLQKYKIQNELTIAYTGALGKVNAVDELLDLAMLAQTRNKPWQFLIMGEGSHREMLLKKAEQLKLSNVIFIPFGNKEKVNEVLSISDFAWISFAHLPVLKTNSPNKFFDAIAAGKAILVNHKGWVYDLVKENKLGISCLPHKLESAFTELENLENHPEKIVHMSRNSRQLAEKYFSKEIAVARLNQVIQPSDSPTQLGDEVYILTA